MSSIKPGPLIIGVVALIASAGFWLMYMGNGIAYGSLVGLKGRESDLQELALRGAIDLAAAAIFQITAWVAFRFSWSPLAGAELHDRVRGLDGGDIGRARWDGRTDHDFRIVESAIETRVSLHGGFGTGLLSDTSWRCKWGQVSLTPPLDLFSSSVPAYPHSQKKSSASLFGLLFGLFNGYRIPDWKVFVPPECTLFHASCGFSADPITYSPVS